MIDGCGNREGYRQNLSASCPLMAHRKTNAVEKKKKLWPHSAPPRPISVSASASLIPDPGPIVLSLFSCHSTMRGCHLAGACSLRAGGFSELRGSQVLARRSPGRRPGEEQVWRREIRACPVNWGQTGPEKRFHSRLPFLLLFSFLPLPLVCIVMVSTALIKC